MRRGRLRAHGSLTHCRGARYASREIAGARLADALPWGKICVAEDCGDCLLTPRNYVRPTQKRPCRFKTAWALFCENASAEGFSKTLRRLSFVCSVHQQPQPLVVVLQPQPPQQNRMISRMMIHRQLLPPQLLPHPIA
jgi:hypothetical protein